MLLQIHFFSVLFWLWFHFMFCRKIELWYRRPVSDLKHEGTGKSCRQSVVLTQVLFEYLHFSCLIQNQSTSVLQHTLVCIKCLWSSRVPKYIKQNQHCLACYNLVHVQTGVCLLQEITSLKQISTVFCAKP